MYYLLKKVIYAIGKIVVDCEISHYILKFYNFNIIYLDNILDYILIHSLPAI